MSDSIFDKLNIPTIEEETISEVTEVIPTNIIPLDIDSGIGGIPRGRITTIVGTYSTGKSTLGMMIARSNQRLGGKTLILDTEFTYEKFRLKQLNVKEGKDIAILQEWKGEVLTMEKIESIMLTILRSAKKEDKLLIIWDTISSTPLEAELTEKEDKDKLMGRHSKIASRMLRSILKELTERNVTLLMILQPKTDPMLGTTTFLGEKPVKFHSSIIINLSRYSKDDTKMVIAYEYQKNKCAIPFKKGRIIYYLDSGFDYVSSWEKAVGKASAFYTLENVSVPRTKNINLLVQKKDIIERLVTESLYRNIPYKILVTDDDMIPKTDDRPTSSKEQTEEFITEEREVEE